MKYAYPVTTPECGGNIKALMEDYDSAFPFIKEKGYDAVELLIQNPDLVDTGLLDRALQKYGLTIAAIGTSPMQIREKLFLLSPNEANRREARRRCSGLLKLAAHYHAPAVIGKYRGMVGTAPGTTWADLKEVMTDICTEAESLGVRVLIEPQNITNINNLNTITETIGWIRGTGISNLGILADIYHMAITERDICDSLRIAGNFIGFVHMSDSERKIPGQGIIPIQEVIQTLESISYEHYISFEINQTPDSRTAATGCACLFH